MSETPKLPRWILTARIRGYRNAHADYPREARLYGTETLYGDWNGRYLLLAKDFACSRDLDERLRQGDRRPYHHDPLAMTNARLEAFAARLGRSRDPATCGLLYGSALANLLRADGRMSGALPNAVEAFAYARRVLDFVVGHMPRLDTIVCMGHDARRALRDRISPPGTADFEGRAIRVVEVPHPAARISTARQISAWAAVRRDTAGKNRGEPMRRTDRLRVPSPESRMARPRNHASHIHAAVVALVDAVTALVTEVGRSISSGGVHGGGRRAKASRDVEINKAGPKRRGPGKGNKKLAAAVASSWAKYTPKERAARIAKMHAWRKKKGK